ncbi:MAG: hypothetical protein FWE75_03280, partial [Actinomycetia bacterium]|nr:hypothetical protein [Actinomycetes bacterium]
PVSTTYRLDHTDKRFVARVLSAWSVSKNLCIAALTIAWGVLASATSPRVSILTAGILLLGTPLLLLAVGCALVWCDYHWPLDVLASWCLTLTLLSGVAAAQVLARAAHRDAPGAAGSGGAPDEGLNCSSGSPG